MELYNKYECAYDFALDVINRDDFICILGHYPVIKQLLTALVVTGCRIGDVLHLEDGCYDDYEKEFCMYVSPEKIVCVDKLYDRDFAAYWPVDADTIFVHEDCSAKILSYIRKGNLFEFDIKDMECDYCHRIDTDVNEPMPDTDEDTSKLTDLDFVDEIEIDDDLIYCGYEMHSSPDGHSIDLYASDKDVMDLLMKFYLK